ncbi:SMC family ATPase, partial [Vibrio parahaemolyticus]|nr:SMC family ATPase [Vibrio parahaemolyticus]
SQYQNQYNQLKEELGEYATSEISTVQNDLQALNAQLLRLQAIDIEKLERNVEQLNQRCVVGENKIHELQNQMAANESTVKANQEQLAQLQAFIDPKYSSSDLLEREILLTNEQILSLNTGLEKAQNALQQAILEKSNAESHLATNKQWLSESEQKLSQAELAWNEALQASKFEDESHYLSSRVGDDELQAWQQEIDSFKQAQTKLEQTLHDLNHA